MVMKLDGRWAAAQGSDVTDTTVGGAGNEPQNLAELISLNLSSLRGEMGVMAGSAPHRVAVKLTLGCVRSVRTHSISVCVCARACACAELGMCVCPHRCLAPPVRVLADEEQLGREVCVTPCHQQDLVSDWTWAMAWFWN